MEQGIDGETGPADVRLEKHQAAPGPQDPPCFAQENRRPAKMVKDIEKMRFLLIDRKGQKTFTVLKLEK